MACIMTALPVLPVRAARATRTKSSKAIALRTSFTGKVAVAARPVHASAGRKAVTSMAFDQDWLKKDPLVFVLGFLGWTVPSTIGVSAFGGSSLFGLLMGSIGEEMAHFPTGPALDDKFWLYLFTWHIGLFTTMLLGQVGVQGKKQGYW